MNKNYDEIDNIFFDYFDNNQEVPNIVTNGIKNAMSSKYNKYKIIDLIKKIIITIIGLLTITSGVVFAKNIKELFENLYENMFGNYNNGITTAVENGYIQDIDMEYIESNNIKVKVDQITMDNYNLGIIFNIELNEDIPLSEVYDINFKNILIMDENNNVIFAEYENQDDFVKYCEENNLDKGKYGIGYANCAWNGRILNTQGNNVIYSFYTTSEKFPASKNLNINFDSIYLLNYHIYDEENEQVLDNHFSTIKGDWKMNINLEEMQKERKSIEYFVININDKNTSVENASLSMSNMRLELVTNSNKIDFKKLQKRERVNVIDMIPFHESYIETSSGERFFESNSGTNGYDTVGNKKIRYYTTFDYTYFDKSENIKIVLPTNKNEDLIIEMKANNFEAQ